MMPSATKHSIQVLTHGLDIGLYKSYTFSDLRKSIFENCCQFVVHPFDD